MLTGAGTLQRDFSRHFRTSAPISAGGSALSILHGGSDTIQNPFTVFENETMVRSPSRSTTSHIASSSRRFEDLPFLWNVFEEDAYVFELNAESHLKDQKSLDGLQNAGRGRSGVDQAPSRAREPLDIEPMRE